MVTQEYKLTINSDSLLDLIEQPLLEPVIKIFNENYNLLTKNGIIKRDELKNLNSLINYIETNEITANYIINQNTGKELPKDIEKIINFKKGMARYYSRKIVTLYGRYFINCPEYKETKKEVRQESRIIIKKDY